MPQKAPISYNTKSYNGRENVALYFIDFVMLSGWEIIKENNPHDKDSQCLKWINMILYTLKHIHTHNCQHQVDLLENIDETFYSIVMHLITC